MTRKSRSNFSWLDGLPLWWPFLPTHLLAAITISGFPLLPPSRNFTCTHIHNHLPYKHTFTDTHAYIHIAAWSHWDVQGHLHTKSLPNMSSHAHTSLTQPTSYLWPPIQPLGHLFPFLNTSASPLSKGKPWYSYSRYTSQGHPGS